jgi:hypothetical protein
MPLDIFCSPCTPLPSSRDNRTGVGRQYGGRVAAWNRTRRSIHLRATPGDVQPLCGPTAAPIGAVVLEAASVYAWSLQFGRHLQIQCIILAMRRVSTHDNVRLRKTPDTVSAEIENAKGWRRAPALALV